MPEGQIQKRGQKDSIKTKISWNRVAGSNLASSSKPLNLSEIQGFYLFQTGYQKV
jgi:hypothetical protein